MHTKRAEKAILKQDALGRVTHTREQREALLNEFERSGMKGLPFARMVGVNYQTFASWIQKRRSKRCQALCLLPGGAVTTNHYDARDWLDETTDATGRKTTFTLDAAGQRTQVKNALNHTQTTYFDQDGRAWFSTDPLNQGTETQLSARGEATATIFADHTPTNSDHIVRAFDAAGRMTTMQNRRGHLWGFGYDDAGRPTRTTSPLLRQWTRSYDTQGRLLTVTEPSGESVTHGYDARDRVTTRTFKRSNGTTAVTNTHTYDANGNLLTTTEGANVLTRTYDQRDRVLSFTNAQSEQIGYRYDASGNLVQLIYPGGMTVTYAYDNRERLSTITDWSSRVTTLSWDAAGRLLKVARPNGTYREYQYDAAGRMIQVAERFANKHAICVVRFALDAAGRPTKKLSLPIPQPTNVTAVAPTYDADNRMSTLLGYGLPHDLDGNLEATILPLPWLPVAELYWDTRNRLTDVWEQVWDGNTFLYYYQSQYTYDAEGHRTHQIINGVTTRYTVNPHGLSGMSEVLVEHKPDATKRRYIWGGPAGLLYETQSNSSGTETAVRYYHSDQVGSTLAITNASATVTARLEYSPYGVITHGTGVVDTPFRYNGAHGVMTDFETGLIHMRARYYHPLVGRFVNEDPIGFDGGSNWYGYAGGDPILRNDPSGRITQEVYDQYRSSGVNMAAFSQGYFDSSSGRPVSSPEYFGSSYLAGLSVHQASQYSGQGYSELATAMNSVARLHVANAATENRPSSPSTWLDQHLVVVGNAAWGPASFTNVQGNGGFENVGLGPGSGVFIGGGVGLNLSFGNTGGTPSATFQAQGGAGLAGGIVAGLWTNNSWWPGDWGLSAIPWGGVGGGGGAGGNKIGWATDFGVARGVGFPQAQGAGVGFAQAQGGCRR